MKQILYLNTNLTVKSGFRFTNFSLKSFTSFFFDKISLFSLNVNFVNDFVLTIHVHIHTFPFDFVTFDVSVEPLLFHD